jgi:hypothetical protein
MAPTPPHSNFGTDENLIYAAFEFLGHASVSNELDIVALSWIDTISRAFLLVTLQLTLTFVILICTQALSSHATMRCSMNVGSIRRGDHPQLNFSTTWERLSLHLNQHPHRHLAPFQHHLHPTVMASSFLYPTESQHLHRLLCIHLHTRSHWMTTIAALLLLRRLVRSSTLAQPELSPLL